MSGQQLCSGYWQREELSRASFVALDDADLEVVVEGPPIRSPITGVRRAEPSAARRWFRTGDLGRWDPSCGGLRVLGRQDAQVKLNGMRVELEEVEVSLFFRFVFVCHQILLLHFTTLPHPTQPCSTLTHPKPFLPTPTPPQPTLPHPYTPSWRGSVPRQSGRRSRHRGRGGKGKRPSTGR